MSRLISTETFADCPMVLRWTDDGWIPACPLCRYIGKPREDHATAMAAVRQHRGLPAHRSRLLSWRRAR